MAQKLTKLTPAWRVKMCARMRKALPMLSARKTTRQRLTQVKVSSTFSPVRTGPPLPTPRALRHLVQSLCRQSAAPCSAPQATKVQAAPCQSPPTVMVRKRLR